MSGWTRLRRGETQIDFVGRRRRWFALSAIFLAISAVSLITRQLNLGLEFTGGLSIQAPNPAGADLGTLRSAMTNAGAPGARIQLVDAGHSVLIQNESVSSARQEILVEAVMQATGSARADVSLESVGPTFGALVARRALVALVVFVAAVVLFISWRLEWKMALTGITALAHDLLLTVGVYSLTGFEVTPATVVAVLTILGYSLYDTVVVFDKVEELEGAFGDRLTYSEIVDKSMNQVLVRSINTSLTSLLPVGSLLFVGSLILGAATLRDFALALFVGIAAGTYSSIFVAAPLLATWKEREETWVARRQRLERKAARAATAAGGEEQAPTPRTSSKAPVAEEPARAPRPEAPRPQAARPTPQTKPTSRPATGAKPRPPKKKRKRR